MTAPPGISGDIYRPVRPAPVRRGQLPVPAGMPRRVHQTPPAQSRPCTRRSRRRFWNLAQYPLIVALAFGAAASAMVGQAAIAVYALAVVASRRIPSSASFVLALVILVSIPVFSALGQSGLAHNAAIYVFELLVVGTVQAIIELKNTERGPASS